MPELYAECPWGHEHDAVNVPDHPEAVLHFQCQWQSEAPRLGDGTIDWRAVVRGRGQSFFVRVCDLKERVDA